jgi:phosphoesterase RecJ-like protein
MMMMNNIIKIIKKNQSFIILPHLKPDGDAIGSSLALAKGLKKINKNVKIISLDAVPYDVKFLDCEDLLVNSIDMESVDIVFALDSSDIGRLEDRKEFLVKPIVNIDHHKTNTLYGELNLVKEDACSTGEIIYNLLNNLKIDIDSDIATDLYTAIASDTGNFMYSNTTAKTHEIAAELITKGIDVAEISMYLYQNIPLNKFKFNTEVLNKVEFYFDSKVALVTISKELKDKYKNDNTDSIVESIRNIEGVEVAILIDERKNIAKISMRSKKDIDVSSIALKNGGGGHVNAAGFEVDSGLEAAKKNVIKELGMIYEGIS